MESLLGLVMLSRPYFTIIYAGTMAAEVTNDLPDVAELFKILIAGSWIYQTD